MSWALRCTSYHKIGPQLLVFVWNVDINVACFACCFDWSLYFSMPATMHCYCDPWATRIWLHFILILLPQQPGKQLFMELILGTFSEDFTPEITTCKLPCYQISRSLFCFKNCLGCWWIPSAISSMLSDMTCITCWLYLQLRIPKHT